MDETEIYAVFSDTIIAVLLASGPILILAVSIGLAIAFFQALTQIQEMTLTFVPKIIVVFLALIILAPYMIDTLQSFMVSIMDKIISLDG